MNSRQRFEQHVLPHLDAAYNLARWLLRDAQSAEDAVQEAAMRALRYIDALRDGNARPWLLGIVRNTCFTMLEHQRGGPQLVEFDDESFATALESGQSPAVDDPAALLQRRRQRLQVDAAIRALTPLLREVIVLREFEELDYAEIAKIIAVPLGTVMSRLARARDKLRAALAPFHSGN